MTELWWRWSAQARLMRDEFLKHRCLGQAWRYLLEAAEKTVSRSFLCLWFVVSQSVMLVERLFFRGAECVLCGEDVWLCMCACARVGFDKKIIIIIIIIIIVVIA